MHEGQIHRTGTPRDLRQGLGLKRLIVRTGNLSRSEEILHKTPGITDAERFGDRLDVMVQEARAGEKLTRETLSNAGIEVQEITEAWPTLENTFVSLLRQSGDNIETPAFPFKRKLDQAKQEGTAIGARNLSKRFGNFDAVKNLSLEVRHGEIYGLLGANGA